MLFPALRIHSSTFFSLIYSPEISVLCYFSLHTPQLYSSNFSPHKHLSTTTLSSAFVARHQPYLYRVDARRSSAKKSLSQPGSKSGSRANTPGGTTSSGKSLLILSVMKRISQSAQRRSSSPRLSGGDSSLSATRGLPTTPSGVSAGCRMRPRRSLAVSAQPATPEVFSPAANTDATDRCVEPSGRYYNICPSIVHTSVIQSYCMSYRFSHTVSVIQSYNICHSVIQYYVIQSYNMSFSHVNTIYVIQYLSFSHTTYVIQYYVIQSYNMSFSHVNTVERLTNDHPHQRPSLSYDHISCDGQGFLFVYESLTSDHPSYTTTPM